MTRLSPAILVPDLAEYRAHLAIVRQLTNRFQLDVIDGEFVDNKTVQPEEIQPLGGELKMDLHLMVNDPVRYAEAAVRLRPNLTIFQYEVPGDLQAAIARMKKTNLKVGIALNPKTDLEVLNEFEGLLSQVLIMAYPAGFAAQEFQPKVLRRVEAVRDMLPYVEIGLDGGVSQETVKAIADAKVDIAYVNSALFGADDPLSRYSELMGAML